MKRIYTYILLMLGALAFVGCQKDFDGVFTADIQSYEGGNKVYVDGEGYSCWHDGDSVMINGNRYGVAINGDVATIVTGMEQQQASYRAVYPAKSDLGVVGTKRKVEIFQNQTYVEKESPLGGMVQVVEAPMVAYTTSNVMSFFNAASLLKVTVTGGENQITVNSIDVSASADNICGAVPYTQNGVNEKPTVYVVGNNPLDHNTINFTIPSDKFPNGYVIHANQNKSFYIVIAYTKGAQLTVKVNYDGSESRSFTMKSSLDIPVNHILNLSVNMSNGISDWEGSGTERNPYQIRTLEDLTRLSKRCSNTNTYSGVYFKQTGNITIDENFKRIENFHGNYDGNGQNFSVAISDHQTNDQTKAGGMFHSVGGNAHIHNMNVRATINPQGDKNVGGVVNTVKSGSNVKIDHCTVNGTIEGKKAGGICGQISGAVEISYCVNKAAITGPGDPWVGGFVGEQSGSLTLKNCANYGNITCPSTGKGGGMIGYNKSSSSTFTIENSYSVGNVTGEGTGEKGGIIGESTVRGTLNNVYVGGTHSGNVRWIIAKVNALNPVSYTHVYSPSDSNNVGNTAGTSITQYDATSWKLSNTTTTLVQALNNNRDGNESWVGNGQDQNQGQPRLAFEPVN